MDTRKQTGRRGEEIAAAYLACKGYRVVQRNWSCSIGELDLVAELDNTLVFVEVRTRKGERYGTAEESITPAKQARLVELAYAYLQETAAAPASWRIDVVAVRLAGDTARVNHIENAVGW